MRIYRPFSRNKTAALLALAAAGGALAQDSARSEIEQEGTAAAARIERAIAGQGDYKGVAPAASSRSNSYPDERRRAAEALRRRLPDATMEARARAAAAAGADSLAAERAAQAKHLRRLLGLEPKEEMAIAKAAPPAAKGWVPVLFASSSIPVTVLRSYAIQLERVGGVLAFRGMPGGLRKVAPMAQLTAEILRIDPGCEGPGCAMRNVQLIVDPIVFRQHGIMRVPALAMIPGDPVAAYCERDDDSPRSRFIVYGDSALSGLLEEYARLGGHEEVRDAQARLDAR